jgi:hypothetical protein
VYAHAQRGQGEYIVILVHINRIVSLVSGTSKLVSGSPTTDRTNSVI